MSVSYANPAYSKSNSVQTVTSWPGNRSRVLIGEPDYSWWPSVKERLETLVSLERGWDGYAGRAVKFENAYFTANLLAAVCDERVEPPSIVPGPNGDLQVEWHIACCDIEIHVRGANDVHAWRFLGSTDEENELFLKNDFRELAEWIAQLSEIQRAASATAA